MDEDSSEHAEAKRAAPGIALAMAYTGFMLGRHYEATSKDTINQAVLWKEYKAAKVKGH